MTSPPENTVDLDYLHRCKASTPEQRLDWLVAAQEFVRAAEERRSDQKKTLR